MNNHLLKRLFGVKYPIIQAPMAGGITTPSLVTSVCDANALGFLASGYLKANVLEQQIKEVKGKCVKPFGVNIFITESVPNCVKKKQRALVNLEKELKLPEINENIKIDLDEEIEKKVDLIVKYSVPIASFTFGVPDMDVIEHLKKNNVFLIGTACNIKEALLIENLRFDAIVLQGSEAGGHRGSFTSNFQSDEIGLISLLQQAKSTLKIPYFASGGISTGDAMLACMVLGAQAVQIGTGFLMTKESGASTAYKNHLSNTKAEETVITDVISGKKARGVLNKLVRDLSLQNETIEQYPIQNSLSKDLRAFANKNCLTDYQSLWCGQGIECLKEQTVQEFIERIIKEYNAAHDKIKELAL